MEYITCHMRKSTGGPIHGPQKGDTVPEGLWILIMTAAFMAVSAAAVMTIWTIIEKILEAVKKDGNEEDTY